VDASVAMDPETLSDRAAPPELHRPAFERVLVSLRAFFDEAAQQGNAIIHTMG
jgi:hypothetical protein